MSKTKRRMTFNECVAELDRLGEVIEKLEARLAHMECALREARHACPAKSTGEQPMPLDDGLFEQHDKRGSAHEVVVIYWEWTEDTSHAGARFWGCHARARDGRILGWPKIGLRPLAAASVLVTEGQGMELVAALAQEPGE